MLKGVNILRALIAEKYSLKAAVLVPKSLEAADSAMHKDRQVIFSK